MTDPNRPQDRPAGPNAGNPATGPSRDAQRLSADELLARPAPLPVQEPDAEPLAQKLGDAARRVGAAARSLNEKVEPARRARAAGKAIGEATGKAWDKSRETAGRLAAQAAPHARSGAEKVGAALGKGAAGARDGAAALGGHIARAARKTRAQIGSTAAGAADKVREARNRQAALPASELDRLMQEEAGQGAASQPPRPAAADGLPLFTAEPTATPRATAPAPAPAAPPAPATAATPRPLDQVTRPAPAPVPAAAAPVQPAPPAGPSAAPETPTEAAPSPVAPAAALPAADAPRRPAADQAAPLAGLSDWARHPASWGLAALALLASGFALGRWSGGGVSEARVGELVEARLMERPEILPAAMERLQRNRAAAAIAQSRQELTTAFSGAWAGNPQGDVTLVVFTDFACTFCRASEADLTRLLNTDRNLKVVFRQLPILSADSERAARVALAASRRGQYLTVHRALFEAGSPDANARTAALTAAGLRVEQLNVDDPAIEQELRNNGNLARRLGIDGTPSWIVGDQMLVGAVGYEQLRRAIAQARR